jgi:hypothetical protein
MRNVWIGIAAFLGLAVGAAWYLGFIKIGAQGTVCNVDGGMDASSRTAMEAVARQYLADLLAGRTGNRQKMMTDEAWAAVSQQGSAQKMQVLIRQIGPFTTPRLDHFYHVVSAGAGGARHTLCTAGDGKDWVSLQTIPGREQAYVLFSTTGRGKDDWAVTEWLVREDGAWRIENYAIMHASMAGHDARELLNLARRERAAGHRFNATMLYVGAQSLVNRGPALQLALTQTIGSDEQDYPMASELTGKPPFAWGMNGNVYSVTRVLILSVYGKLGLSFDLPQKSWSGPDAADAANRAFLTDFVAAHPEVPKVFGYLVARADKPDNSGGWGTVWSAEKGFLPTPKR